MSLGTFSAFAQVGNPGAIVRAAACATAALLFFSFLAIASRGAIGRGDVALSWPIGAILGWLSWVSAYMGVICSFAIAAVVARCGRENGRDRIAFGPYLIAGVTIMILVR
ncbi:hypothetical protein GCM10009661_29010 [Catellatospora chokoriensis]|uniref:Type IV leader peptidase family protein n=2 Tax=Catellatospora chokoriensis TaxID=310353 RepID=A0A8J3JRK0_9ACTN|nr:hypothetical protein Cch02nite_32360 [Catellatospora chokoriensis]